MLDPPARLCAALLLASLLPGSSASAQERTRFELAAGTPSATWGLAIDSGVAGPTLLVIGGMHGNEPAGASAAQQIAGWTPTRGRLVVVPRANARALEAGERHTPGLAYERADLNRQFPHEVEHPPEGALAEALWQLVEDLRPDWLIDLHEAADFAQEDPESTGSTIIVDGSRASLASAESMLAAVNADIAAPQRRFVLRRIPVAGSLARAAHERLAIGSMILETTKKGQDLALRARQHRILVHALARELGIIEHGPHVVADPRKKVDPRTPTGRRADAAVAQARHAIGQAFHALQVGARRRWETQTSTAVSRTWDWP